MLEEWNATEAAYPREACLHELFQQQVTSHPEAIAVSCDGHQLTYEGLDRQANQLAHYLRSLGVGPEVLVGLCTERSPVMVVGVLAVLKAGGAYIPLDPNYPLDRLALMIEDAQLPLLLTQAHLRGRLPATSGRVVCLDTERADWETLPSDSPAIEVLPHHLAYAIFTSGSTGRPKGALLTHGGLTNFALGLQQTFGVGPGDRVLQFASLSFDASVWEMAQALASGATLCLPPAGLLLVGETLLDILRDQAITAVILSPSALATLPQVKLPALRHLGCRRRSVPYPAGSQVGCHPSLL